MAIQEQKLQNSGWTNYFETDYNKFATDSTNTHKDFSKKWYQQCWRLNDKWKYTVGKLERRYTFKLWTSSQPFNLITTLNHCEFQFLFFSFRDLLLFSLQLGSGKSYVNCHDSSAKSSKILPSTYGCKSAVVCKTSMIAVTISSRALFDISCRYGACCAISYYIQFR